VWERHLENASPLLTKFLIAVVAGVDVVVVVEIGAVGVDEVEDVDGGVVVVVQQ